MAHCFVIQPFNRQFDWRFERIFSPAILACGLDPYRVDRDPSTDQIMDQIETKIREAVLCLADISLRNPNVWYELGFAQAAGKRIVLVCDDDLREGERFPFDVQSRNVTVYQALEGNDMESAKMAIGARIASALNELRAHPLPPAPIPARMPTRSAPVTDLGPDSVPTEDLVVLLQGYVQAGAKTVEGARFLDTQSEVEEPHGWSSEYGLQVGEELLTRALIARFNPKNGDLVRITRAGEDFLEQHAR